MRKGNSYIFNSLYLDFLNKIKCNNNRRSISKICSGLIVGNTASVYLKDMELRGLITKYKSGRCLVISMTENGNKLLELYNLLTTREVK